VNHEAAQNFLVAERGPDRASLEQEYGPVFNWFRHSFPALARQLDPEAAGLTPKALALLASAPWSQGNAQRGAARFVEWRCHGCHAPPNALGPDLAGVAGRLSLTNVILAIVNPSFAMAPAHRATQFEMRDRTSHAGQVVFESAERVLLRTGATSSARLAVDDIVARRPSPGSLMPEGLLEGVRVADVADLYAFLRALKGPVP
jgi:putative heme-binding domain-containing protein